MSLEAARSWWSPSAFIGIWGSDKDVYANTVLSHPQLCAASSDTCYQGFG